MGTKTFISWTTNPANKGWTAFDTRGAAEAYQDALPEEHRGGITTGSALPGTVMINGEVYPPNTIEPLRLDLRPEHRLMCHGK